MFYFGLFLPLVFITASFSLNKKEQLYNSLLSSVSILLIFYMGLLLNRTVGGLSFLDHNKISYFNGFESPASVAIMLLFLLGLIMSSVFFRKGLKNSLSPWNLAHVYACIFLVTAFVATENLLVFLFACESFIWMNVYQIKSSNESKKTLYLQSAVSTGLLLILTIFLGLLENISFSEMTYSLDNLSKISLSYVSGTIYSTQTLFFIMALIYLTLKVSFLIHILTLKVVERNTPAPGPLLVILGVPAILYCFYTQQIHFYGLAYKEYGCWALGLCFLLLIFIYIFQFQSILFSWSKKWTD